MLGIALAIGASYALSSTFAFLGNLDEASVNKGEPPAPQGSLVKDNPTEQGGSS